MTISHFLGTQSLTVVVGARPRNVPRSHPNFDEIVSLLQDPEADEKYLLELLDPLNPVRDIVIDGSSITVEENGVSRNGEPLPMYLQQRIIDVVKSGLPVEPWKLFVERWYANPSIDSRVDLARFMEKSGLPMTPEGKFLAYKRVNVDYTDTYSRKIDNSVGRTVTMPGGRTKVNPDRNQTCSYGLHFCSQGYLKDYYRGSGRIMILEIDPADVVSIPVDYNNTKGRTWRYTVVGEVPLSTEEEALEWGIVSMDHFNQEALDAAMESANRIHADHVAALEDGDYRKVEELEQAKAEVWELVRRIQDKLASDAARDAEEYDYETLYDAWEDDDDWGDWGDEEEDEDLDDLDDEDVETDEPVSAADLPDATGRTIRDYQDSALPPRKRSLWDRIAGR